MLMPYAGLPRLAGSAQWSQPYQRRLTVLAAAALVLLAVGVATLQRPDAAGSVQTPATRTAQRPLALGSFANRDGGYELSHPTAWSTSTRGTTTEITSPGREAAVSVGLGARGPLAGASSEFVRLVRRGYAKVTVTARRHDSVAGAPALAVAGQATNPEGVRIRWMGIAVQHKPRNLLVAVYTHADADPAAVLPPTQQIVSSLRFLR